MTSLKVGGTPLRKSLEYCGRCGGATVYVKDESKNPFGTFKDRRCAAVLKRYADKRDLLLVHITNGNSGYSLGMMARSEEAEHGRKIAVVNVVPKGTPKDILRMLRTCSVVEEIDLGREIITQERLMELARKATGFKGPEDNIASVEDYGLGNGYQRIIREISSAGVTPTHIFCPVGEGELAVELASAARDAWGEDAPIIIGATIKQNLFASGEQFMSSPGNSVADKLVNGYSKFRELLLNLVRDGKALITVQGERRIADEYSYLNSIGISAEPSAASAFCAAASYGLGSHDTAVIINTGKGLYDHKAVDKLWHRSMRKALKYAAVALASIAVTAGAFLYKHEVERKNRFLELQQQELAMQVEWESIGRIKSEASHILDRDGDSRVSYDEYSDIFRVLSGKTNNADPGLFSYDSLLDEYTESELRYYTRYRELGRYNGNVERDIMHKMQVEYLSSLKKPKAVEPTVGERSARIFRLRQIRKQLEDGTNYCTFRDFDMLNPMDRRAEPICD